MFDSEVIDDCILDLVVLKYVCYALLDFRNSKDERAEKLDKAIRIYPGFDSSIESIEKMGLIF